MSIIEGGGPAGPSVPVAMFVEAAYLAFGGEIRRLVLARSGDGSLADDLSQDAFVRLHVEVAAGRTPRNVRPWLHRVTSNLLVSRARHRRVDEVVRPRLWLGPEAGSTEEAAVRRESQGRVAAALAELRPIEREILLLAAAGARGPEIAEHTGRTCAATRTLLCRARGHLRDRLERTEARPASG